MDGTPSELRALRDQLAEEDAEIVRRLAARMQLIARVAELKARGGIAPFDREREGAHLDDLLASAATLSVPADLVRDVFGALFAASRRTQRIERLRSEPRFSIGIVGGTAGMGGFLARVFASAGYEVETTGLDRGAPAAEVASRHDLVIVAVPIAATEAVIRAVAPHVRAGACLADVTSLKRAPMDAMLASAPAHVDVVGAHPMFGPRGEDFDRQKVVLCRGRGEAAFERMKRLFEAFGAEIIVADPAEHDAQMALIQVLVHEKTMVLGSVLERLRAGLARSRDFASPVYRAELAMIGRMFSQGADLYAEILTSNPDGAKVSRIFHEEAGRFADAIARGERAWIVTRFREVAAYMTDFAAWAKKESEAILDDIVRHG